MQWQPYVPMVAYVQCASGVGMIQLSWVSEWDRPVLQYSVSDIRLAIFVSSTDEH